MVNQYRHRVERSGLDRPRRDVLGTWNEATSGMLHNLGVEFAMEKCESIQLALHF